MPNIPPIAFLRKLSESPTPWMYLAICAMLPAGSITTFSCSSRIVIVSGVTRPPRFANSLTTFVILSPCSSPWLSAVSIGATPVCCSGPFQVPSAQNTILLGMANLRGAGDYSAHVYLLRRARRESDGPKVRWIVRRVHAFGSRAFTNPEHRDGESTRSLPVFLRPHGADGERGRRRRAGWRRASDGQTCAGVDDRRRRAQGRHEVGSARAVGKARGAAGLRCRDSRHSDPLRPHGRGDGAFLGPDRSRSGRAARWSARSAR